jgi:hypothetical protein
MLQQQGRGYPSRSLKHGDSGVDERIKEQGN